MTHMLCEILAQALGQINSVATRLRLGFPASPRQLRTLILTLPSAMPKQGEKFSASECLKRWRWSESHGLASAG